MNHAPQNEDEWQEVLDLGPLRKAPQFGIVVAYPLNQEVLPRVLAPTLEYSMGAVYPQRLTFTSARPRDFFHSPARIPYPPASIVFEDTDTITGSVTLPACRAALEAFLERARQ